VWVVQQLVLGVGGVCVGGTAACVGCGWVCVGGTASCVGGVWVVQQLVLGYSSQEIFK
jgi:hypothetical protein